MRTFLMMVAAVLTFGTTMTFEATDANAVVCARGVYRAGCAGYRGAAVVRRPVGRRMPHRLGQWRARTSLLLTDAGSTSGTASPNANARHIWRSLLRAGRA